MIVQNKTANKELEYKETAESWWPQKKVMIILFCLNAFFFVLWLSSLPDHKLHIDEPILAEQVYWLLKEGDVRSVLYTGIGTGLEDNLLVYHKLFIWVSAGLSWIFGQSLPLFRSISLLFSVVLIFLLYRFCHRQLDFPSTEKGGILFNTCLLLLLSNFLFLWFSFLFRPELMQTTLGFGSFYLCYVYLKKPEKKYLIGSGVLAGLSTLVHLNGLIFIGAGFLLLLSKKKVIPSLLFLAPSLLVSFLYLIDVLATGEMNEFFFQFSGAPAFKNSHLDPLYRLERMIHEHKRYFHSPLEGSFTVLFLLLISLRWRMLWMKYSTIVLYLLFSAFCLAVINQGYTNKYALPLLPFAVILMALSFYDILRKKDEILLKVLAGAFFIYLGIQFFYMYGLFSYQIDLPERNATISKHILPEGKGKKILATASFFIDEGKKFQHFSTQPYLAQVYRFGKLSLTKKDFFKHASSLNCEYVILDLLFQDIAIHDIFSPADFQEGKVYYGYKISHSQDNYVIMEKQ